jgi:ribokinase
MLITVLGSYIHAHCLCVNTLPQAGESIAAQALWSDFGGKGLNLALGLNKLGLDVHMLLAVGEDAEAQGLQAYLQAVGLNTDGLSIVNDRSGFGVGLVTGTGENVIAVYAGANHLLNQQHIQQAVAKIQQSYLVCAQFEILDEPILAAFCIAKQAGVKTLLNPSPWRIIDAALLALTDILILNASEASRFFNANPQTVSEWQALLHGIAWQGELLIVTLGELGCLAYSHTQICLYQPAWHIHQVDATGAGDAFTVGLIYALSQNQSLPQALSLANACGALVASQQGVAQALPTTEQVYAFMNSTDLNAG